MYNSSQFKLTVPLDKIKYHYFTTEYRHRHFLCSVREVCYPLGSTQQLGLLFHDILPF